MCCAVSLLQALVRLRQLRQQMRQQHRRGSDVRPGRQLRQHLPTQQVRQRPLPGRWIRLLQRRNGSLHKLSLERPLWALRELPLQPISCCTAHELAQLLQQEIVHLLHTHSHLRIGLRLRAARCSALQRRADCVHDRIAQLVPSLI